MSAKSENRRTSKSHEVAKGRDPVGGKRRSASKRASIYEPLEQRVLMCYEPHDLAPLPVGSNMLGALPAQTAAPRSNGALSGGGTNAPDGGTNDFNIVWTNRGQTNDNFAATFDGNAGAARAVVDAVIQQYERIISSMNWTGAATQHSVNISMRNQAAPDFGGQCPPNQVGLDASGSPVSATIFLGRGSDTDGDDLGDGAGWYLDPTPNDFAEFSNVVNAFVGTAPGGSPAAGIRDFYSLVAHEMGHAMGMTSQVGSNWRTNLAAFSGDSGFADGFGNGNLWNYQSAAIGRAVLTDSDGGGAGVIGVHTAVGGQSFNLNAQTYTSAMDVMNNTFGLPNNAGLGRRLLVSNLMIGMIDAVSGYDNVWPEQFGSMYTSLNTTTGQLTLRGGTGGSHDTFSVLENGGGYQITVNIDNDIVGTGPTDAFVSTWTDAQISSIVIEAGDGNDVIEIRTLGGGEPVTIEAGTGNDEIRLAIGDFDTDLLSNIDVDAGTGTDLIWVNDLTDGAGSDTYTVTNASFAKPGRTVTYTGLESLDLNGSDNDDVYNINSFTGTLIVDGQDGDDTFNLTQSGDDLDALDGRATLLGASGVDTMNLYDASDTAADNYLFDSSAGDNLNFTKPAAGSFEGMLYSSMQNILLEGNGSHNNITVDQMFATNATLRGNGGNDAMVLGNGNLEINISVTDLRFEGGAGTDSMLLDDTADTGDDTHLFDTALFVTPNYRKANDPLVVSYTTLEDVVLDTSSATNRIEVNGLPLGTDLAIEGNLGQDTAVIGGGDISDNIGGVVTFDAFLNGTVIYNDAQGNVSSDYDLDGGNFTAGGITHHFANAAHAQLHTSDFSDHITIESTFGYDVLLHANGGSDLIRFGGGSLASTDDATIYGGDGSDELFLDDTTTFAPTTFEVNQTGGLPFVELFNGAQMVIYDSITLLTVEAGPHDDTIRSIAVPSSTTLRLRGHGGADTIDVQGHPTQNSLLFPAVVVDGGAGLDTVEVNTDGQGGARAEFLASQDLASLQIGASGRLRLNEGNRVIETNSTTLPSSGFELDLTDGMFVRHGNASFPYYWDRLAVGYNAGAWNGMAINSSFAETSPASDGLGIARASELFNGAGGVVNGVNLAATDIVIRHVLNGDANVDGTVNLSDFNRVAANFGASGTTWAQGNFNYDNVTNLADFNLLAGNFGMSAGPDGAVTGRGGDVSQLRKLLEEQTSQLTA